MKLFLGLLNLFTNSNLLLFQRLNNHTVFENYEREAGTVWKDYDTVWDASPATTTLVPSTSAVETTETPPHELDSHHFQCHQLPFRRILLLKLCHRIYVLVRSTVLVSAFNEREFTCHCVIRISFRFFFLFFFNFIIFNNLFTILIRSWCDVFRTSACNLVGKKFHPFPFLSSVFFMRLPNWRKEHFFDICSRLVSDTHIHVDTRSLTSSTWKITLTVVD